MVGSQVEQTILGLIKYVKKNAFKIIIFYTTSTCFCALNSIKYQKIKNKNANTKMM